MLNPDFREMLSVFSDERATGDIDLWIRRSAPHAERVWRALVRYGVPLAHVTIEDLTTQDLAFQIGVAPRRIDILTSIDGVEFDEGQPRCESHQIEGLSIPVLSRIDLVRNKQAAGRPQDIADIAWLERTQTP